MQGLLILKRNKIKKDQREFLCAKILKISIVIKNVKKGLKTLWCIKQSVLAIIFSNFFTHYQAEQIKKDMICVQMF